MRRGKRVEGVFVCPVAMWLHGERGRGIQHPNQYYFSGQKWLDSERELRGICLHSFPGGHDLETTL